MTPHSPTQRADAPSLDAPAIRFDHVHKRFGRTPVLQDLSLRVPAGKTYCFLGRNGAGKTTSIRLMLGLLRPDSGNVRILGLDPVREPAKVRAAVGYLAEDQQMWPWMTVGEIANFMAPFYSTWDAKYAGELMDRWQLPRGAKIKHLSKGQNVRLGLLLALAHRPKLVILDDPALGLDPIMRKEFLRDVVTHLQGNNVTVFFSSHLLYEIEPVADMVAILHLGKLTLEENTETARERVKRLILPARTETSSLPEVLDVHDDGPERLVVTASAEAAIALLRSNGVEHRVMEMNLDEIFAAYVTGRRPDAWAVPAGFEAIR